MRCFTKFKNNHTDHSSSHKNDKRVAINDSLGNSSRDHAMFEAKVDPRICIDLKLLILSKN